MVGYGWLTSGKGGGDIIICHNYPWIIFSRSVFLWCSKTSAVLQRVSSVSLITLYSRDYFALHRRFKIIYSLFGSSHSYVNHKMRAVGSEAHRSIIPCHRNHHSFHHTVYLQLPRHPVLLKLLLSTLRFA